MYLECVSCPKIGVTCDGPNFYAMTPPQLITWCKERKKYRGLTNEKIADMCDMPKGTIDSLFSNKHPDFKFGTIAPILKILIGGDWTGAPCPDTSSEHDAEIKELREKIAKLESGIEWRDEKIALLEKDSGDLRTLIANTNARHTKSQDFLRKVIIVLGVLLFLALAVIIGALIVDRLNSDIGFIWIDKMSQLFHGNENAPFGTRIT